MADKHTYGQHNKFIERSIDICMSNNDTHMVSLFVLWLRQAYSNTIHSKSSEGETFAVFVVVYSITNVFL